MYMENVKCINIMFNIRGKKKPQEIIFNNQNQGHKNHLLSLNFLQ